LFERSGVPAGDHALTIDGITTFIAATPTDVVQRPHIVAGHQLLG
jgi:hypothetical protein